MIVNIRLTDADDVIEFSQMLQQMLHEYLHWDGCNCAEEEE